jgi:putative oxidoreductase
MASGDGGASDLGLLFVRLTGIGLASHGYDAIFHGGMPALATTVGGMGFPLPAAFAWAAVLAELLGGALVAVGLYTRFGAAFAAVTMFVAAFVKHASDDFKTRELSLLYLAIMLAIACLGAGKWSLDGLVRKAT